MHNCPLSRYAAQAHESLIYFIAASTAVSDQIVHFYDRSLKICHITNIAEIIISRYGTKSSSVLVDVMEYDMRSARIVKKWEIERW